MNRKTMVIAIVLLSASAVVTFAQQNGRFGGQWGADQMEQSESWGRGGPNAMGPNATEPGQMGRGQSGGRNQMGPGQMGRGQMGPGFDRENAEEVELSGTIQLEEDTLPVLRVGSDEYTLFVPPVLASEVEVTNGARISVEGLAFTQNRMDLTGDETVVHVQTMQVGNTRYVAAGPRW